jgi:hypothetical protein
MKGAILRGVAALSLVITVIVIALMVTKAYAQMHQKGMMGGRHMGMPCPWDQGMKEKMADGKRDERCGEDDSD